MINYRSFSALVFNFLLEYFISEAQKDISEGVKIAAKRIKRALLDNEQISSSELFLRPFNSNL